MVEIFRIDKVPKPRSWYYSGITNMYGESISGNILTFTGRAAHTPGEEITSLSPTKGGKLQILANFTSMLYVENTIFRPIGIGSKDNYGHPIKIIIRGINIVGKKLKSKLIFLAWDKDSYFLTAGGLGRFPDRSPGIISLMGHVLDDLFNSNYHQRVILQKALYFTFKDLVSKLEEEKDFKGGIIFHA